MRPRPHIRTVCFRPSAASTAAAGSELLAAARAACSGLPLSGCVDRPGVDTSHANAVTYLSSGDAAMKRRIHGATWRAPMQTDLSLILDCDELASSHSLSPDHYLRHNAKFSRGQAQSGAPSPRPDPHPSDGHLPATGTAAACRRLLARRLLSRLRPRAQQSAKLRTVTRHSRIDSAFRRLMAPVDALLGPRPSNFSQPLATTLRKTTRFLSLALCL